AGGRLLRASDRPISPGPLRGRSLREQLLLPRPLGDSSTDDSDERGCTLRGKTTLGVEHHPRTVPSRPAIGAIRADSAVGRAAEVCDGRSQPTISLVCSTGAIEV